MNRALEKHTEQFAAAIVKAIQAGTAPWQKPWERGANPFPRNFKTARYYTGSNLMLLLSTAMIRGYPDPRWGGFQQIAKAGGSVRRGEMGTPILIVRPYLPKLRKDEERPDGSQDPAERNDRRPRSTYLTSHYVFNAAQTDRLALEPIEGDRQPEWDPVKSVESVAADAAIQIVERPGGEAAYYPLPDFVEMPSRTQFEESDAFYHTLLHELAHATAHPSRLDRPEYTTKPKHGSEAYALEELRAEMSAMMTGAKLEIGHSPRHGESYLAHWASVAEANPAAIRKAAHDAQAITDWLVRNQNIDAAAGERLAPAA